MAGEAPSFRPGTVDPGHVLATAVAELTATFDYD
jgi:hypothetical protein